MLLKDKVAIVTGGTRGIGRATVIRFLEEGAKVALFGSRIESVENALATITTERPDAPVIGLYPQLDDPASVSTAVNEVFKRYGRIDILVNNAAISPSDSFFEHKPELFDEVMRLNVDAVFYCSQAAARIMKDQGGGVILNTASVITKYGQTTGCSYPASKYAVDGLTVSLARELGQYRIRVNAVAPGVTNTDMVAVLPDDLISSIVSTIPLGRIGEPEDIANAFAFLASDKASYISGTVLRVDGAALV